MTRGAQGVHRREVNDLPIFDEIPRKEWRRIPKTKRDLLFLEALLTGKYVDWSFNLETRRRLPNGDEIMRRFEELELFEGFVPVLSEKGRRYLEGLRLIQGEG